jgi:fructose-bisphosphate aldolase class I
MPAAFPGIEFLSGGLSPQETSEHLKAMNENFISNLPWVLTFSFSRTIEHPAIDIWKGLEANASKAKKSLYHRAKCNAAARREEYNFAINEKFNT